MSESDKDENARIDHSDSFTGELTGRDRDGTYDTFTSYEEHISDKYEDKEDYGPVEQRGCDIEIEHPVGDVVELKRRAHLAAQLREVTRELDVAIPDLPSDASVTVRFDALLLAVFDTARSPYEDILSELDIADRYVKALYIREARGLSHEGLCEHLEETPETAHRIGFTDDEGIPSDSSFWRRENELSDEAHTALQHTSTRAMHALYRNGREIPEDVSSGYRFQHVSSVLDENELPADLKREALRDWVQLFFTIIEDSLTFHRADNTQYPMTTFIGLFAHSALQGVGIKNGIETAGWLYDDDAIPNSDEVITKIKSLSRSEVSDQFLEANKSILQVCDDRGFFTDSRDFTCDTTEKSWYGDSTEFTINRGDQSDRGSSSNWRFTALGIMETDARFLLDMRLHTSKDKVAGALEDMLENTVEGLDMNHLLMDSEFYSSDAITGVRTDPEEKGWVVDAKIENEIKERVKETPKGDPAYYPNVDAVVTPCPNLFVYPKEESGQSSLNEYTDEGIGNENTHKAFLTDLTDSDTSAEELYEKWLDRWNIETFMNQFKHHFHPVTESQNPIVRVYMMNLSALFFNLHTLINRCPAPEDPLRLDVTHSELLTAIRDVAFSRSIASDE